MFRKILPLCLLLSLVGAVALAKPGQVIIIRHGEKPAEGDDLTVKGRERAAALAPFFQDGDYRPVAIYAVALAKSIILAAAWKQRPPWLKP